MSCNCIKDTGDKLAEKLTPNTDHFKQFAPKGATAIESANATNMVLALSSGEWRLQIPYSVKWKDSKKRETSISIIASHCPFCGKQFNPLPTEG